MNIKGKLVEIFDTVQVTETFKKREFIVQDNRNPEYPEYIKVELIQDKVSLLDSLSVGDEINVLINIKGRKWEDILTLFKVGKLRLKIVELIKKHLNNLIVRKMMIRTYPFKI